MNFKGFESLSSDQYLAGESGVIVYLESTDDEFIFKKWFGNLLSKIEFKSVSGRKEDGGCYAVIQKVTNAESDELANPCYGVVDRDVFLNTKTSNDDLWWETDDSAFYSSKPFGENVFILNRWELENYLLHPRAMHKRLVNAKMGDTSYDSEVDLIESVLNSERDLVAVTVLSTLGRGDMSPRFAQNNSGDDLWSLVTKRSQAEESKIMEHERRVVAFSDNESDAVRRWDRLSRMLDGKRAMVRIDGILNETGFSLERERANLADDIANFGLIDSELRRWVEDLQ